MWPISPAFIEQLESPVHSFRSRLQVLDTDFNPVSGGQFDDTGSSYATNFLVDGSVDLDITRAIRRTFTASLTNNEGEFSPGSDWAGLLYVNRLIRLYRGIAFGDAEEVVPVGTFMIDHADVVVERNMSMVVLSGSDLWKKITKSKFSAPESWAVNTPLTTVIRDIAGDAGITSFVEDISDSRPTNARQLNTVLAVETGDERSKVLLTLASAYGLDLRFDPLGRFVIGDYRTPELAESVWEFDTSKNAMTLGVRSSYKDDNLYNHILVVGTGGTTPITSERSDTNPLSVTSIDRIGDRLLKYESDLITTQAAADAAAEALFYQNVLVSDDITLDTICNPALDGNDVVTIKETEFSGLDGKYQIRRLSVPLATSRAPVGFTRSVRL